MNSHLLYPEINQLDLNQFQAPSAKHKFAVTLKNKKEKTKKKKKQI